MADGLSGRRVRVHDRDPLGFHCRVPAYLRGRSGVIERSLGAFPDPERRAYHRPSDPVPLVRVRFTMAELWGDAAERPGDTLDAEIYAHWLEDVTDAP